MTRDERDEPGQTEPRQTMLSFFQHTPTYCELTFTHKHQTHETDLMESESLRINVYVLMCLTTYFDHDIKCMSAGEEIVLEMPLGRRSILKKVIKWVVFGHPVDDFGNLIECVEFCRFYGIQMPSDPNIDPVQQHVDEDDEIPYLNTIPAEPDATSDVDASTKLSTELGTVFPTNPESTIEFEGKQFRRKWMNRQKTGWYYRCAVRGCEASLFVAPGEMIRVVHDHSDCCRTCQVSVDCTELQEIGRLMKSCVARSDSKSSFDILSDFIQCDVKLAKTLLSAPLSTVLRYITTLRKDSSDDTDVDEVLTAYSRIKGGGVIYQQVLPARFIVYAFPDLKSRGATAQWLLIDGTFRSCPKQFAQCVTIMSRDEITGVFFPLCHCLLPDRTEGTYDLMFEIIEQTFCFQQIGWITVDFERALVKATERWISKKPWKIRILGCKFHFSKAITKRFRGNKRKKLSDLDSEFLSLMLLTPFMKIDDIRLVLRGLSTVQHPHESFIAYFRKNWMKEQRFQLWNISEMVDIGLQSRYTNNGIESFHKVMNNELPYHPNIGVFLRWAEVCAKERLQIIEIGKERDVHRDADTLIHQLDAKLRWEQLIQRYEVKPEFTTLQFYFVCPECGVQNSLAGRRTSHLRCKNPDCRFSRQSLPCACVWPQVKTSLLAALESLSATASPDTAETDCTIALRNLRLWITSVPWKRMGDESDQYIEEFSACINSFLDEHDKPKQQPATPGANPRKGVQKAYKGVLRTARLVQRVSEPMFQAAANASEKSEV